MARAGARAGPTYARIQCDSQPTAQVQTPTAVMLDHASRRSRTCGVPGRNRDEERASTRESAKLLGVAHCHRLITKCCDEFMSHARAVRTDHQSAERLDSGRRCTRSIREVAPAPRQRLRALPGHATPAHFASALRRAHCASRHLLKSRSPGGASDPAPCPVFAAVPYL
jgi:hypothetical protein